MPSLGTISTKNIGHFLAFTKEWFEQRQAILLWFLNAPVIKIWARWILRINRQDIPLDTRITQITPNCFSFGDKYVRIKGKIYLQRITDFRCHPKFAKRIYFAFKPVWWALHYWDELFADKFAPQWSFGFSTLTVFPDPDAETSSVDGYVQYTSGTGSTWATVHDAGSGTASNDVTTLGSVASQEVSGQTNMWSIRRAYFLFNTSALTAGATISAAVFSLVGELGSLGNGDPDAQAYVNVYSSNPASNTALGAGDYSLVGTTAFSTQIGLSSFVIDNSTYNNFTLNASGLAAVSKTGVSKFSVREGHDAENLAIGANLQNTVGWYMADQAGTSQDPKLVVTYVAPVAYTKSTTDTLTITALSLTNFGFLRSFLENLTITDTITRAFSKVFNEVVTITASVGRAFSQVYNEAITILDAPFSSLTVSLLDVFENITITDTYNRAVARINDEVITITDTITAFVQRFLTAATETITITDDLLRAIGKNFLETITISTNQFLVLVNGIVAGVWRKVGRLPGIWRKINRKDN